jgi:hypothetical protein
MQPVAGSSQYLDMRRNQADFRAAARRLNGFFGRMPPCGNCQPSYNVAPRKPGWLLHG